jgi:hypothetical protein
MSLSFSGFKDTGSGHLGTGVMIEMTRWVYGYGHRTGLGSNWDALIVDRLVFSRARVRADDFDWDLER